MPQRRSTRRLVKATTIPGPGGGHVLPAGSATFTADQVAALLNTRGVVVGESRPLPRLDPMVPFGPGMPLFVQPINPVDQQTGRAEPRQYQYPVSFNLPGFSDRLVPWSILRAAADNIPLFRRCIQIRKEEVATTPWDITVSERAVEKAQNQAGESSKVLVEKALREKVAPLIGKYVDFWEHPDRRSGLSFVQWCNKLLEEFFVLDAVAIYPRMTLGGDLYGFEILDGTTIKPLIDEYGFRPAAPGPAYQQILWGFPRGEFIATVVDDDGDAIIPDGYDSDQLIYEVHNVRTFTPYGYSAVEQALDDGDLYLRRHGWLKAEYTDGVMPSGWLEAGPGQADWTPQQLKAYETALNDYYAGQTAYRQRFRILPYGMKPQNQPDLGERYRPDYDLHLIKLLAGHFSTTIAELGFTEPGGLGSAGWHEGQADVQDRTATQPTRRMLQELITKISRQALGMPKELEFRFLGLEAEDEDAQDETAGRRLGQGRLTLNEDRDRQGKPRYPFKEADMPFLSTGRGLVFLEGSSEEASTPGAVLGPPKPLAANAAQQIAEAGDGGPAPVPGGDAPASNPPPRRGAPASSQQSLAKAEVAKYRRWRSGTRRGPFTFEHVTRDQATAAGLDLERVLFKAEAGEPGPKGWPGWDRDLQIADHYAPLVSRALIGALPPAELTRAYLHKAEGEGPVAAALHWLSQRLGAVTRSLLTVVVGIQTEGYFVGRASASAQIDRRTVDWSNWEPGDPEAARALLVRDGGALGLQELLNRSEIVIKSIAQHRLGELAEVLARGLDAGESADALEAEVRALLTNKQFAHMIAVTETTRASTAATLDVYREQGKAVAQWLDTPDGRTCPVCRGNAAAGPVAVGALYPSGDWGPPAHPNCRCALAPAEDPIEQLAKSVRAAATGHEGDARRLHDYWTRGEGLAKWAESPHPFRALREHLAKFPPFTGDPDYLNRTVASWYHDVFGVWPGRHGGKLNRTQVPDLAKVGPGGYIHGWIHVGAGEGAADRAAAHVASHDDPTAGRNWPEKLAEDIRARHPNVKIDMHRTSAGHVVLSRIVVPRDERGGTGTALMHEITAAADRHGDRIALTPSGDYGGSVARLKRFYARHGFAPNEGRNRDYTISEDMIREPMPSTGGVNRTQVPDLAKVGPHGYEHGWIKVGVPSVGDRVHHPRHGGGQVMARGDGHLDVQFDSGHRQVFEEKVAVAAPAQPTPELDKLGEIAEKAAQSEDSQDYFTSGPLFEAGQQVWGGSHAGYSTKIDRVMPYPGGALWEGTVHDATGAPIGEFHRGMDWTPTGVEVSHALLILNEEHRGQGFAESFNAHAIEHYRRLGVDRVTVDAGLQTGGYAWARAGFDFYNRANMAEQMEHLRGVTEPYRRSRLALNRAQAEEADRLLARFDRGEWITPYEISQVGRRPGQGGKDSMWLGKRSLLGQEWLGVRKL